MGRPSGGGKWLVEGCRHIDVLDWRRDGYLQPPAPGKPPDIVTAKCGGREQRIATVWTPCRFSGKRPWFWCGYCGRRVLRLYVIGGVFACRHCHRLGYESRLETPHQRGSGRAQKIRRRLGSGIDDPFGEFPAKPRGMHRRTYERWRRVHDAAEERSTIGLMGFVERLGRRSSRRA
jgi:hypothetical protein